MSSATPTTPKRTKNPRRNQKRTTTPMSINNTHSSSNGGTTSSPHLSPPPPNGDLNGPYESANTLSEGGVRRKKGRAAKKNQDSAKSPGQNGNLGHRHTTSQPHIESPKPVRESPHYAGPTFHASPAPSALPIPSFFSKSVPESDSPRHDDSNDEPQDTNATELTPTKAKMVHQLEEAETKASPLDFLFKAAREANNGSETDGESGLASPPHTNARRPETLQKSEGVSGGIFPLEMDTPNSKTRPIGPSFATSYKERMNALRSASTPSPSLGNTALEEEEKKAKAQSLKNLLLNPTPQRPASASPQSQQGSHIFRSGSMATISTSTRRDAVPTRHASGPVSPIPSGGLDRQQSDVQGKRSIPHQYLAAVCNNTNNSQNLRTPPSSLRREVPAASLGYSPSPTRGPNTRISPAQPRFHGNFPLPHQNMTIPPMASGTPPVQGVNSRMQPMDQKQMEDDLRRFLKLGISDGHNVNGIEHSIA